MAGDPLIFEIGCLGRIAHAQERPDGTFQILLLGEKRFRILSEEPHEGDRLYRSARVELLTDIGPNTPEASARLERQRGELLGLIEDLVRRVANDGAPTEAIHAFERLDPARLINSLTQSIALSPIERQQLLEADSILSRFEIMADLLRFRLAEIGAGAPGSPDLPN
jgi:Lon protease-like protein